MPKLRFRLQPLVRGIRMRSPDIEFGHPLNEALDPFTFREDNGFYWHGQILIFTNEDGEDVEKSINHEYLHYLIDRIAGKRATKKFDKICKRFKELR